MTPAVRDQIRREVDLIERFSQYYHRRLATLIDDMNHARAAGGDRECLRLCVEAVGMILSSQNHLCRTLKRLGSDQRPISRAA